MRFVASLLFSLCLAPAMATQKGLLQSITDWSILKSNTYPGSCWALYDSVLYILPCDKLDPAIDIMAFKYDPANQNIKIMDGRCLYLNEDDAGALELKTCRDAPEFKFTEDSEGRVQNAAAGGANCLDDSLTMTFGGDKIVMGLHDAPIPNLYYACEDLEGHLFTNTPAPPQVKARAEAVESGKPDPGANALVPQPEPIALPAGGAGAAPAPEPVALAAPAPAPSPVKADKDASNVGTTGLGAEKGVRGVGGLTSVGTTKKGKSAASKGEKFDFHGGCDLVLVKHPGFSNNLGLDLNIRTKINSWWSYIDSAVIRIGNEKLEVTGGNDGGQHWINGDPGDFLKHGGSFTLSGFTVHAKQSSSKQIKFRVDLGGAAISIETYKSFVAANVHVRNNMQFIGSGGLMGSFPTGEKMARDGSTVIEDPISFGKEWQVLSTEPMYFHSVEGPQHPEACAMPSASQAESRKERRLGQAGISQADAEAACAHAGPEEKDACVFDVLATQDKDMAGSY